MATLSSTGGRRVLVTGAGTGIGRAIALEFARQGASVALHYARHGQEPRDTAQLIQDEGGTARAFDADFDDFDQTRDVAERAIDCLGGLDVLINNAGITMNERFERVTRRQFEMLLNVNLRGMFFVTQIAVSAMTAQGKGAVIHLSSVHAFRAMHEYSIYAATKGAIVALTRELALELWPRNIRVNAIAPGCIVVENYARMAPDLDLDQIAQRLPVGHTGTPNDVAYLALFLASDEARFISGQTYVIDGGQTTSAAMDDSFRRPSPYRWGAQYIREEELP